VPDWSIFRISLLRSLAEMSALFRPGRNASGSENWAKVVGQRSSPVTLRLKAALFLSYHAATGARESDTFHRNAKTWALFEHAVLPEVVKFTFFDKSRDVYVSAPAVLADSMFHVWTVTELGLESDGRPTTIAVISELAKYVGALYDITRVDRRKPGRSWFGVNRRS
jgi:hypothetical protein